jgi:DNA-binding MarR family transcriptional regulator
MPRLAQPAGSEDAEDPIAHLGNLINAGVLRYLRAHPNSTVGPIAAALALRPTTIKPRLDQLEEAGLVISDPPASAGQPRRGVWITYRVNSEAVTDLYLRLGAAIGEF